MGRSRRREEPVWAGLGVRGLGVCCLQWQPTPKKAECAQRKHHELFAQPRHDTTPSWSATSRSFSRTGELFVRVPTAWPQLIVDSVPSSVYCKLYTMLRGWS